MQFRKDCAMKCCEVMGVFVPKCHQNHGKGYKFEDQTFVKNANHLTRFDD